MYLMEEGKRDRHVLACLKRLLEIVQVLCLEHFVSASLRVFDKARAYSGASEAVKELLDLLGVAGMELLLLVH